MDIIPNITEYISPDLKLFAINKLDATGKTINDDIRRAPTILMDIATVTATSKEKNTFVNLHGTPAKLALSSSNVM